MTAKYWECNDVQDLIKTNSPKLAGLPAQQRERILNYLFDDIFEKFSKFFGDRINFRYHICLHFQPRKFKRGQVVLEQDESISEVLLVYKGHVGVGVVDQDAIFQQMIHYKKQCIIGDYQGLLKEGSSFQYRALTNVYAFAVPLVPLKKILDAYYPKHKIRLLSLGLKNINRIYSKLITFQIDHETDETDQRLSQSKSISDALIYGTSMHHKRYSENVATEVAIQGQLHCLKDRLNQAKHTQSRLTTQRKLLLQQIQKEFAKFQRNQHNQGRNIRTTYYRRTNATE